MATTTGVMLGGRQALWKKRSFPTGDHQPSSKPKTTLAGKPPVDLIALARHLYQQDMSLLNLFSRLSQYLLKGANECHWEAGNAVVLLHMHLSICRVLDSLAKPLNNAVPRALDPSADLPSLLQQN